MLLTCGINGMNDMTIDGSTGSILSKMPSITLVKALGSSTEYSAVELNWTSTGGGKVSDCVKRH